MASKMRITVNFSSSELYKFIVAKSEKTKNSFSSIIESLALKGLGRNIDSGDVDFIPGDMIKKNKNLVPAKLYSQGLEFNYFMTSDNKIYTERSYSVSGLVFDINIPLILKHHPRRTSKYVDNEMVRGWVSEDLKSRIGIHDYSVCTPDIVLSFVYKVNVTCHKVNKDGTAELKISYSYHFIPVYMNKREQEKMYQLDFMNIKYRSFLDVAKKGWNRGKYSHILHIQGMDEKTSGGYFVGVLNEPQTPESIISQYIAPIKVGGRMMIFKVFMEMSLIKIRHNTFPEPKEFIQKEDSSIV